MIDPLLTDDEHLVAIDAAHKAIEGRGRGAGANEEQIMIAQQLFSDGFEAALEALVKLDAEDDEYLRTPPQFHGAQFGIDWDEDPEHKSCAPGPCVRLWSEDDEIWHLVTTFDATWLPELARVAAAAAAELPSVQSRKALRQQAQQYLDTHPHTDEAHLVRMLLLQVGS